MADEDIKTNEENPEPFSLEDFKLLFGLEDRGEVTPFGEIITGGGHGESDHTDTCTGTSAFSTTVDTRGGGGVWLGHHIGTMSSTLQPPNDDMAKSAAKMYFANLHTEHGVDDWMQVACCLQNPESQYHDEFTDYLRKSEEQLYGSRTSTELKAEYKALKTHQLFFNVLRGYLRAEEENFDAANVIFTDLYEHWAADDKNRQMTILLHCFISFLFSNKWDQATDCFQRAWSALKIMDGGQRHNLGAWDDWTCMLILLWYFNSHVPQFARHFCEKLSVHIVPPELQHKSFLLKGFTPELIAELVSKPYYRLATKTNQLPPLEEVHESDS